jgi:phosphoglycolate phosphatase-like HAD superfamily hydrolase
MTAESTHAAIVFDFDGTLVDSSAIKKNSFMHALGAGEATDRDKCEVAYAAHGTINRTQLLALSFTDIYSRPPSAVEHKALVDAYTSYFRAHMEDVTLFPGLPEFYAKCDDRYQLMISSNAPREEIVELCGKLRIDRYFTRIYGHPVGKAAALRQILADFDFTQSNVLYIGDRVEDGMVAESVGVPFFRLDPGFHSPSSCEGILRSLAVLADRMAEAGLPSAS